MQTFIYSRQSSGNNEQSISIDQQVDNCKALAKKEGLTVTKVFEEYNCSGRLFPPQLKSLAEMDSVYQDYLKAAKKCTQACLISIIRAGLTKSTWKSHYELIRKLHREGYLKFFEQVCTIWFFQLY